MSRSGDDGATWRGGFSLAVYAIVASIPAGRLMTYGQIARNIPPPKGIDPAAYTRIRARWVGYALASCPEDAPWHRVVNRHGKVSSRVGHGPHVQPHLLAQEGVIPDSEGAYDLSQYGWDPEKASRPGGAEPTDQDKI